ncbi:hypothetical protein B1B05_04495 [Domibacillus enclensis]|uniref:TIGR00299 family protein n=1 Tax=Domibacillus enclensis TaxID=1017273 RepID=A0A1N6RF72_9BACI|nr:hypothetical protein B1B05_04495 [Domibacillus enclensis]SIQ27465.1 hypothetical protein SAMN05443094_102109 [Domibacillus enclensis]
MNRPPNEEHLDHDMIKMEVNLDDISGEWLGHVMDLLFEAGANDVFYTPIYMKKNRPGVLLQLLCAARNVPDMERILFRETTTLGIRYYPLTVHRLERQFIEVSTKWGPVTVKCGLLDGEIVQRAPEYEDCRAIALQNGVPLKEVYEEVWKSPVM